jgi:hypothetical protein
MRRVDRRPLEQIERGQVCDDETCSELKKRCTKHGGQSPYFGRRPFILKEDRRSLDQRVRDATAEVLRRLRMCGELGRSQIEAICDLHSSAGNLWSPTFERRIQVFDRSENQSCVRRMAVRLRRRA